LLKLDHLTVIAPTLSEGVSHAHACLGLDVPFGSRHDYMGTHNHRLQLGDSTYLEIVALDPEGINPGRSRWFGLDDQKQIRTDWEEGRRLRGWVANTEMIDFILSTHAIVFGEKVLLPAAAPNFSFTIPKDGTLPLDGAAPSLIDHQGDTSYIAKIPDLGARLSSLTLEHPHPASVEALFHELLVDRPPKVIHGPKLRYRAAIETLTGIRELT
jgi:Glyoxalase-like domain